MSGAAGATIVHCPIHPAGNHMAATENSLFDFEAASIECKPAHLSKGAYVAPVCRPMMVAIGAPPERK